MPEAATRPIILRRLQLSTAAWRVLSETAADALDLTPATDDIGAPTPLDAQSSSAAWAELATLGLSPQVGEVQRAWMGAVALLLSAPITITARATYAGVSTTSVMGVRGGRGLAVHQRHLCESTSSGTTLTGSEDSVEVTLFDEENLWGAMERLLPPLSSVRAPAKAAPLNVDQVNGGDESLWPVHAPDGTAGDLAGALPVGALPEPLASLAAGEDSNVTLTVQSTAEGHPPRMWAGMWSVKDEHLYSVRTHNTAVSPQLAITEVPPGHIAHELIFAVVGAHDALTNVQAKA
ncbi:hypothetical protein [Arthrobacter cryoconiti]|uniref:Uncharacterized protein n=1 Tax=Arthrobacter cryoconiti TaxID=748907 RepID=A0ABV8R3I3_9MICC|nr:hypothetical protein [Arthrobacter cryoconiti]MCC9066833.1 hypothetical protein [Arthrobacter cryoconiti]